MARSFNNISLSSLNDLARRIVAESTNSNFLWRIVLFFLCCGAIAIGFFAWLVYGEATTEPALPLHTRVRPPALSIEELRGVISFYQKKEEDFKALHTARPLAPALSNESGMSPSPTQGESLEQTPEQLPPE
jgi:hypothetical protein